MKTFDIYVRPKQTFDLLVGKRSAGCSINIYSLPVRFVAGATNRLILSQTLTSCILCLKEYYGSLTEIMSMVSGTSVRKSESARLPTEILVAADESALKKAGLSECGIVFSQNVSCITGKYRMLSEIDGLNLFDIDNMTLSELDYVAE